MLSIIESTAQYETWLAGHLSIVPGDLELKHRKMAGDAFSFMRATFYRWAVLWRSICSDLASAPAPLAVGDLHVENFGTWRDTEGRLIWGINDFDEAAPIPYTNDLVRLAVSANLAIAADKLSIDIEKGCDAIIDGYTSALRKGGYPYVLAERHQWLRTMATGSLRDPEQYWRKFDGLADITAHVSAEALGILEQGFPKPDVERVVVHRIAGLGSLGRERYTMVADYLGGRVAREIKRLAPSAWDLDVPGDAIHYAAIIAGAHRVPDPFLAVSGTWVCRRLAPDCSRIELDSLPRERDEARLLKAMGSETANVHLGTPAVAAAILRDLEQRSGSWLKKATTAMTKATMDDWKKWGKGGGEG